MCNNLPKGFCPTHSRGWFVHRGKAANGREQNPAEPTGEERRKTPGPPPAKKNQQQQNKVCIYISARTQKCTHTCACKLNKINLMANLRAASHSVGNLLRIRGRQHVIIQWAAGPAHRTEGGQGTQEKDAGGGAARLEWFLIGESSFRNQNINMLSVKRQRQKNRISQRLQEEDLQSKDETDDCTNYLSELRCNCLWMCMLLERHVCYMHPCYLLRVADTRSRSRKPLAVFIHSLAGSTPSFYATAAQKFCLKPNFVLGGD